MRVKNAKVESSLYELKRTPRLIILKQKHDSKNFNFNRYSHLQIFSWPKPITFAVSTMQLQCHKFPLCISIQKYLYKRLQVYSYSIQIEILGTKTQARSIVKRNKGKAVIYYKIPRTTACDHDRILIVV